MRPLRATLIAFQTAVEAMNSPSANFRTLPVRIVYRFLILVDYFRPSEGGRDDRSLLDKRGFSQIKLMRARYVLLRTHGICTRICALCDVRWAFFL